MLERVIDVVTPAGAMNTFITQPEAARAHPLVLLLMDAPGIREELFNMARRLGTAGYCVAVPNLYYRRTRSGVQDGDRETMYGHMQSLSAVQVCADLQVLLDDLAAEPAVQDGAFGAVGYCMSGPFALAAAAHFGARMAAAASFHGVRLCHQGQDSPHRRCAQMSAELYIGCAEVDAWAPAELMAQLQGHLHAAGSRFQLEWYPDTRHGFVFPERLAVYEQQAAERHWQRLHALFRRTLPIID